MHLRVENFRRSAEFHRLPYQYERSYLGKGSLRRELRPTVSRHSLIRFRKTYGLSHDRLSDLSGLSVQTIYSLEAGQIRYSRGLALYLASTLNVALEELL